jgi:hypothetical protein
MPQLTRPGKFPVVPFLLCCLALLAGLLCWKGNAYPEAVALRRFLAQPEPAHALAWWIMAAGCALGVFLGVVRLWRRKQA